MFGFQSRICTSLRHSRHKYSHRKVPSVQHCRCLRTQRMHYQPRWSKQCDIPIWSTNQSNTLDMSPGHNNRRCFGLRKPRRSICHYLGSADIPRLHNGSTEKIATNTSPWKADCYPICQLNDHTCLFLRPLRVFRTRIDPNPCGWDLY